MPITPGFSWIQNDDSIEVTIEMYGMDKKMLKHFVQITPIYFSLNISPYLLQIDFENEIDPYHIKVIIMNKKETKFIFPKKIQKLKWNQLITTKDKAIKLKERQESIDNLYKKQQEIRERRKKEKKLRFKAAQQRQWNEQTYIKQIINKLENEEKRTSKNELKQWIESKQDVSQKNLNDDNDENEQNKDTDVKDIEIRKSNVIEVGFSEWDYITPVRQNTKPPEFARKTLINKSEKNKKISSEIKQISEITPIFLCDKGMKYFLNKDYESAINAFDEAINLDVNYFEAYCNKYQCYIQLMIEEKDKNNKNINDLLANIDKVESILKSLQDKHIENIINESISINNNNNKYDTLNMIILLQKGIIHTLVFLNKLKHKNIIDDEALIFIKMTLEKGLKLFEINKKINNLKNNDIGLFKNQQIMENVYKLSRKSLNINQIITMKQCGNKLIKNKKYMDAINKYSKALEIIHNNNGDNNGNDYIFLRYQCLNNRSTAYFASKQFIKCINDCNKIIQANHNDYKAFVKRAGSYLSLWKHNNNNQNDNNKSYLEKCLKDYKNASQYDKMYQLHVKKIDKLLEKCVSDI